jgi:hypothetical protein
VIQHGRLGGARGTRIVMARDRVQELRACVGFECDRLRLHEPETKMNVAEQSSLVGLPERGTCRELRGPAHVVQ